MRRAGRSAFIAGGLVLLLVGVAPAQTGASRSGSGSSSSSSSGGFTGSSGGSFTGTSSGSSGGSFTGMSSSGGSFTGTSGGGSIGSGGNSGSSNINPQSTTQFGRYYGNPLYNGLATSSGSSSSSSTGSKYLRPVAVPVSGNALYNAASLTTTPTRGATGIGTQGTGTTTFPGATSAGLRRAPGYVTEPVFDMPARPTLEAIRPELQDVVSRATRLPSRERIRVVTDGDTVVLRGQVRDERESRLAEAMIRLSPGVRLVRNELEPQTKPPGR